MKKIECAGIIFHTLETNRVLFLYRLQSRRRHVWSIPGGKLENGETPWEGAIREVKEEVGKVPTILQTLSLEVFKSSDGHFRFHTFLCLIRSEFIPILNDEHGGYAWSDHVNYPKPLHHGLHSTLSKKINRAKIETIGSMSNILRLQGNLQLQTGQ